MDEQINTVPITKKWDAKNRHFCLPFAEISTNK
jgi:hypothetical protein